MSKCTIASFVPWDINEEKPGLYPGRFHIAKCGLGRIPSILHIGESFAYTYVGEGRGQYGDPRYRDYMRVDFSAEKMATSIVNDYKEAQICRLINEAEPAIFWVPNELSSTDIVKKHEELVASELDKQNKWFIVMIKDADDLWEHFRQHKLISNMQRTAARMLKLDRPWLIEVEEGKLTTMRCGICRMEIMTDAIVCPHCKAILNAEKYKDVKFAGVN